MLNPDSYSNFNVLCSTPPRSFVRHVKDLIEMRTAIIRLVIIAVVMIILAIIVIIVF